MVQEFKKTTTKQTNKQTNKQIDSKIDLKQNATVSQKWYECSGVPPF